jgi:DNA (cytosine-5)-methyltransferase 1
MRDATFGEYPKICLFENVVGLLSSKSNGSYAGSDFKTVLEAFCETEIPMPESGRWANAGMVRGRGFDLAWIIKDASKHFRVPQRRRRLFLVVNFTGTVNGASKILFEPKSLSGYFAARESERKGTPADAESSVGNTGGTDGGIGIFMAGQSKTARSIAYSESVSPTLKGSSSGLNQVPCVCELCEREVYNICSYSSNSMKSSNPKSGIYAADTSRTLDTNGGNPALQQGGLMIVEPKIARTLTARGDSSPCVDRGQNIVAIHPAVAGTLCASGAGLSRPAGNANETDLCVAYCLQGNMIGRKDENGPQGTGISKEVAYTVSATDRHCVAAIDCRNLSEGEVSGTLQAKCSGGYSLNYVNPVRTGYIVRRLTPSECELLMSLPLDWTKYGHDGRVLSDSARYQLCGNSIVVNCLAYIMQNIAEALRDRREV